MLIKLFKKIFSNYNNRMIYRFNKSIDLINKLEHKFEKLTDTELKFKREEFKKRIHIGETLNSLIPEAFATIREASKRIFKMRHFDVQLLGGMILNERCIAEMKTGEGKTLTATLPAYLNAITGKGVHIVTVNDYLAKRDAENNKPLFEFLGMNVGINLSGMTIEMKRKAYLADITYGTNNEFGFDYLRDNMVFSINDKVQRTLHYALIDEVDSILIDEARTPLVISGPSEDSSHLYKKIDQLILNLKQQEKEDSELFQGKGHFFVDLKLRQITLTERGLELIENLLIKKKLMKKGESLYSSSNIILMHHIIAALRAHMIFKKNVDYIVKKGNIIIVDEHTGRIMEGRRWSEGLHQAIEAKEKVKIQKENQTLASITFQNYFRLYEKLAGMTGTAITENFEFESIYKLNTIAIPTNKPMIRKDLPDLIYLTEKDKFSAIINEIKKRTKKGQPILVGTISIEKSELISKKLKKEKIPHNILNAKFHTIEADIIAEAGKKNAITIATNMAGRGTDILLGGNWQLEIKKIKNPTKEKINQIKLNWKKQHKIITALGGLHIIGTERHESRRIDNQLRGRSGRQGDPGSSRFYLSMEDSLMKIFGSEKIINMMKKLGMNSEEAIEHPWITKAIENAQRKVENRNFELRKQLLEYDDVSNDQRKAIYLQRNSFLNSKDLKKIIYTIKVDVVKKIINSHVQEKSLKKSWNTCNLETQFENDFNIKLSIKNWINKQSKKIDKKNLLEFILNKLNKKYQKTESLIGEKKIRKIEKNIMIKTLDTLWKEHLSAIDYLRQGIHLRGYAQKDPKQEYKRESFEMFSNMLEELKYEIISTLEKIEILYTKDILYKNQQNDEYNKSTNRCIVKKNKNHHTISKKNHSLMVSKKKYIAGRNEPCPCGSKKKYKICHGNLKLKIKNYKKT